MSRVTVRHAPGLPLCAVLETSRNPFGPETWIRNLPLTEHQARQLQESAEVLDYYTASDLSSSVTALVHVTADAARRIRDGERWDAVLFGPCPLTVVPRED